MCRRSGSVRGGYAPSLGAWSRFCWPPLGQQQGLTVTNRQSLAVHSGDEGSVTFVIRNYSKAVLAAAKTVARDGSGRDEVVRQYNFLVDNVNRH